MLSRSELCELDKELIWKAVEQNTEGHQKARREEDSKLEGRSAGAEAEKLKTSPSSDFISGFALCSLFRDSCLNCFLAGLGFVDEHE